MTTTSQADEDTRCVVARCTNPAAGVLVYDNKRDQHFEQPLCTDHSNPEFHLRPVSTPEDQTYWTWVAP